MFVLRNYSYELSIPRINSPVQVTSDPQDRVLEYILCVARVTMQPP